MLSRNDLTQFAADAATNPKVVVAVSTATSGIGLSTYYELLSKGFGIAASAAALTLTLLMIRKVLLESVKLKQEINQLTEENDDGKEADQEA